MEVVWLLFDGWSLVLLCGFVNALNTSHRHTNAGMFSKTTHWLELIICQSAHLLGMCTHDVVFVAAVSGSQSSSFLAYDCLLKLTNVILNDFLTLFSRFGNSFSKKASYLS